LLILSVYTVVLAAIAYLDCRYRVIPNWTIVLVAVLTLLTSLTTDNIQQLYYVPLFLIMGFLLWQMNVFAGGDVKLVAFLLPAVDDSLYLDMFVLTMFLWAVTALLVAIHHSVKSGNSDKSVPFGVPMAVSGVIGLFASM
jgi:Flp pilus assembly protein protease CpaA